MRAYPTDVTFFWSFGGTNKTWNPINSTTEGYNITNIGLSSSLYIDNFKLEKAGHYRVYGKNSVNAGREYGFELRSRSKSTASMKTCMIKL